MNMNAPVFQCVNHMLAHIIIKAAQRQISPVDKMHFTVKAVENTRKFKRNITCSINNYPLWQSKDVDEGRAILARLDSIGALTPTHREMMYLDAMRALYGEGSKEEQDLAYMNAMASLQEAHPEDLEARAFHALAILGSTDGERDFEVYARAASVAQPVFEANPDHPGAAHYIIHSFDDPEHADLGLHAANAYSEIAPGAAHAQHMTTHIFLAQGDWARVIQNNQRATRSASPRKKTG